MLRTSASVCALALLVTGCTARTWSVVRTCEAAAECSEAATCESADSASGARGVCVCNEGFVGDGVQCEPLSGLDSSFGVNGVAQLELMGVRAADVVVAPDGRLILAGTVNDDWFVYRLGADGTPDPTFGTDGVVVTDVGMGSETRHRGVVLLDNGSIIVGGNVGPLGSERRIVLVKYIENGQLDSSFGVAGIAEVDPTPEREELGQILVQQDGSLLIVGTVLSSTFSTLLTRLTANGAIDSTFGTSGLVTNDLPDPTRFKLNFQSLALPDGRLAVTSFTNQCNIVMFQPDGAVDQEFGNDGLAINGVDNTNCSSLLQLPDGSFLVGGQFVHPDDTESLVVSAFTASGVLDSSFGDTLAGLVFSPSPGALNADMGKLQQQDDGRIIATTIINEASGAANIVLARFDTDGVLDPTFGTGGFLTLSGAGLTYEGGSAILREGRLWVAGRVNDRPFVARYRVDDFGTGAP